MSKLFIPIVLGTAREGRVSEIVARYVFKEITALAVFETQFVDVRDFLFGKTEEYSKSAEPWKQIMEKADGLIIVSPEYNHSFHGELKILIDSIEDEYNKKPVAVIGVSSGRIGGARMADNIKPTLLTLGMVPLSETITFPKSKELFGPDGTILDESYQKRIADLVREMEWFARTLKEARKTHA